MIDSQALIVLVILLAILIYPFVISVLTTPKDRVVVTKQPREKTATELRVDGPTLAEQFIDEVEQLPNVDKYVKFHSDIKKKGNVIAIELLIKKGSRTTLYQFPDNSYLEISEQVEGKITQEISFKAF